MEETKPVESMLAETSNEPISTIQEPGGTENTPVIETEAVGVGSPTVETPVVEVVAEPTVDEKDDPVLHQADEKPVIAVKCPQCGKEITQVEFDALKVEMERMKTVNTKDAKERLVRAAETGDKVYLIRNNRRFWLKNPETLKKLGWFLGQEQLIPFSELLKNPEGTPIDLTIPGMEVEKLRETIDTAKEEPKQVEPTKPSRVWSI